VTADWKCSDVPAAWAQHSLVRGKFFYTLPEVLLQAIGQNLDLDRFDERLWKLEIDLAEVTGNHDALVGFASGMPISFTYFSDSSLNSEFRQALRAGAPSQNADEFVKQAVAQFDSVRRGVRAYAGWLATNPTFLQEHAALVNAISSRFEPGNWPVRTAATDPGRAAQADWNVESEPSVRDATRLLDTLCSRWRLQQIKAPFLLEPIGQQFPSLLPELSGQQANAAGYKVIAIPDTMPLPSESDLRDMIQQAVQQRDPEHLRDWSEMIDNSNEGKRALERYARIFSLQHYYRLVWNRHSDALHRQKSQLCTAFAAYFGVSDDSIRRDLQLISERLGEEWWLRFPLPATAASQK
jgi:hypothetical protein